MRLGGRRSEVMDGSGHIRGGDSSCGGQRLRRCMYCRCHDMWDNNGLPNVRERRLAIHDVIDELDRHVKFVLVE